MFGGNNMGNAGNMAGMMKKMQKLQADMAKLQEDLKQRTVEVSAGGGAVTLTMTGEKMVQAIKISPDAVDAEDLELLEDLLKAAFNEGIRKIEEMSTQEMGKLTGGMNLPPGMF